jgi:hypothetical protein
MTARNGRHGTAYRPVSFTVGEPSVRPAEHTHHGHFLQRRRSRLVLV